MPAPINVDRRAVEVLVAALGVREAARKMGINENTVLQWSRRGKWAAKNELIAPPKPVITAPVHVISDDTPAVNPARVLRDVMHELGRDTRIGLAKAAKKGAEKAAEMHGMQVLDNARAIKEIAGVASIVHSWGESQASIHISCMGGEQPADALEVAVEVHSVPMLEDVTDGQDDPMDDLDGLEALDGDPDIDADLDSY